jgi:hypothetical protein
MIDQLVAERRLEQCNLLLRVSIDRRTLPKKVMASVWGVRRRSTRNACVMKLYPGRVPAASIRVSWQDMPPVYSAEKEGYAGSSLHAGRVYRKVTVK